MYVFQIFFVFSWFPGARSGETTCIFKNVQNRIGYVKKRVHDISMKKEVIFPVNHPHTAHLPDGYWGVWWFSFGRAEVVEMAI